MYNDFPLPTPWGSVPAWILTVACAAVMIPALLVLTKSLRAGQQARTTVWLVVIIVLPFVGACVFLVQLWIGTALRNRRTRGD